ncbi:MAG: hypothetical protein AAF125_22740, partial [Chloroflexota bacterium]
YNLTLNNLDAMFASTMLSRPKADDEFRVLLIGDSSTWGWFLQPDETYAAGINARAATLSDGRRVVAYNVGYPVLSLTKDLILLDYAMQYEPDMVVWLVTAQSMRYEDDRGAPVQTAAPVSEWPPHYLTSLTETYTLNVDVADEPPPSLLGGTIVDQRRDLANLLRLQVYGGAWGATRVDHRVPETFDLRRSDLSDSEAWGGFEEPTALTVDSLAFDVLTAGVDLVGDTPLLLVNEPIFISDGENSDVRYNSFYPRWAYDGYRDALADLAAENDWTYADWWDMLPPDQFTDTPVHVTPEAAEIISERLLDFILQETE